MPLNSTLLISYLNRAIKEGSFPDESLKSNLLKSINTLGVDLDDNDYEPSTDLEEVIAMLVDDLNEIENTNVEEAPDSVDEIEEDDDEDEEDIDDDDEDDDEEDDEIDDELDEDFDDENEDDEDDFEDEDDLDDDEDEDEDDFVDEDDD